MGEEKKKKSVGLIVLDVLFSTALVVLSCYLTFGIHWTEMYIGIPILIGAAIAFFVGYDRLVAYIPVDAPKAEARLFFGAIVGLSVLIQLIGFVYLHYNYGNQGCAIIFLCLVESLSIIVIYPTWDQIKSAKSVKWFCRLAILVLIAIGLYLNVYRKFTMASAMVGAYMLVDCMALSIMAFSRSNKSDKESKKDK